MDLSEEQKSVVKAWVEEGCGLSEIQRRLVGDMGITLTYMDVRFLVLDLNVDIKEKEDDKPQAPEKDSSIDAKDGGEPAAAGGFSVEFDAIKRPGAVLSGTVTFSDGVTGLWILDQMGRLGIEPSEPGYKPSEDDNAAFVQALQDAVAQKGMM
jgi:hypothetical protein